MGCRSSFAAAFRLASHRVGLAVLLRRTCAALVILSTLTGGVFRQHVFAADEAAIDFDRDVRPILSDACYQCHGPDAEQRQADLRLDIQETAAGVLTPGDASASELVRRVFSVDPDERMPPPDSGRPLTVVQQEVLLRWVEQGAGWAEHWAYVPPERPPLPEVPEDWRVRSPVDRFVMARLQERGWQPSPPADPVTLVRRVTLDLTGLPPSPEDVTRFVQDSQPGKYERLVGRLLASPRFGERLALPWLDAARYADTSGYQNDGPRDMWRWRDWVIDALNQGMPFDQFTIEQLAGDLLPNATIGQHVATGFNRNHRGNAEGGIIPEEYAVEYVVDRVETTATVWLGLTVGCARCHDHKFDPISQREFYQFFAFFNQVPEYGRAIKEGNSPPYIKAPTELQERDLAQHDYALERARVSWQNGAEERRLAQRRWEDTHKGDDAWTLSDGLVHHAPLDELPATGHSPIAVGGRVRHAARFDGSQSIDLGNVGDFGYFDQFSVTLWLRPEETSTDQARRILSRVTDTARGAGYSLTWHDGRLHINLVKRWLDDAIRVRSSVRVAVEEWSHIAMTYDGTRRADGIRLFVNGQLIPLEVELDLLNQSFQTTAPLQLGSDSAADGFMGAIDDVHVFSRRLSSEEISVLATTESVFELLQVPDRERTPGQRAKLQRAFVDTFAPAEMRSAARELRQLERKRNAYFASLPTVMVMRDVKTARPTHVLRRGQYDQPLEQVQPGTPGCLPPLNTAQQRPTRLDLARWIVDPNHPLTARVAVNRYWQMLFGRGLVETPEDFGVQGRRPSHPQLLDWLATEFVRSGWDVKWLLRTIVLSNTYRQSSVTSPEQRTADPDNRWLARGPRFRLRGELVRDQALASSGLLVETLGGPSVKPYQPTGLWQEIASDKDYQQATGSGLYRRSLYTYWKRTVAPPAMVTFDASPREACSVRPQRTNTPLQALVMMNDETFLDAAKALAVNVLNGKDGTVDTRIEACFRLATGRRPTRPERQILRGGWDAYREWFDTQPRDAAALVGASGHHLGREQSEFAAYVMLASLILNLDETITKE